MTTSDTFLKSFLQKVVSKKYAKDLADDENQQKYKVFHLNNTCKQAKHEPKKNKRLMTSKERRSLKLMKLDDSELKFELYLSLNQLWQDYMGTLLQGSLNNTQEMSRRIGKSDFHGCFIRVVKSKCPSLVSIEGIILLETKNLFSIITPSNELKKVPKQNSVFEFEVAGRKVTLYGNNFRFKASERSTRNFKTRPTVEL